MHSDIQLSRPRPVGLRTRKARHAKSKRHGILDHQSLPVRVYGTGSRGETAQSRRLFCLCFL